MSYGFYKMPPRSSHEDYIIKVAGKTMIAIATDHTLPELPVVEPDTVALSYTLEPPKVADTLTASEAQAMDFKSQGYSGDICDHCNSTRLRWAGHCKVCDDCGTTTGCS